MSERSTITCPSCGTYFFAETIATVPDNQRVRLTVQSEGKYVAAEIIGELINAQSEVLRAVAKNMGADVAVFLSGASLSDGAVELEFAVVAKKDQ